MPRPLHDWGRPPLILVVFGFTLLAIFVHPGFVFGLVLAAGLLHGYRRRRTRDAELRPVAALLGLTLTTVSGSHLRSLPPFITLHGLLTAEVLDFFSQRPGVIAEGADGGVLMHRPPCPPAELGALLDDTLALARALRRALRAGGHRPDPAMVTGVAE